jgi:hypothetical protein
MRQHSLFYIIIILFVLLFSLPALYAQTPTPIPLERKIFSQEADLSLAFPKDWVNLFDEEEKSLILATSEGALLRFQDPRQPYRPGDFVLQILQVEPSFLGMFEMQVGVDYTYEELVGLLFDWRILTSSPNDLAQDLGAGEIELASRRRVGLLFYETPTQEGFIIGYGDTQTLIVAVGQAGRGHLARHQDVALAILATVDYSLGE